MENSLVAPLAITVVGMTLLFLSLALFYGLLSLLTAAFKDKSPETGESLQDPAGGKGKEGRDEVVLRAAAMAIAVARAEVEQGVSPAPAPALDAPGMEKQISSWWALHHQRQLVRPRNARRG